MEKNKEQQFDDFLKKAIKEVELDAPPLNFTDNLLTKIEAKERGLFTNYKPLISKSTWGIIVFIILVALGFTFTSDFDSSLSWWPNMSINTNYVFGSMPDITISNTYLYCFIGLMFFLGLQIYFIKNHVNRRFSLN